jgi:hypothetical protein
MNQVLPYGHVLGIDSYQLKWRMIMTGIPEDGVFDPSYKRYLFLLAWMEGSDSSNGDPTGVFSQDDLLKEFRNGNEYIFAVEVHSHSEDEAATIGYRDAFFENYTAYDSLSTVEEIPWDEKLTTPVDSIVVC